MTDNFTKYYKKILWTQEDIESKCKELAAWIDEKYKDTKRLVVVGLLKGCFPFMFELLKNIKIHCLVDFMKISSYAGNLKSSGVARILMDTSETLKDSDVLIVDDIIDTALTITKIVKMIEIKSPKSINVMTLIDKKGGRKISFKADVYGFDAPNEFLIGYGLDVKGYFRHVPFIGIFDQEYLKNFDQKS